MSVATIEPAVPLSERPPNHALDGAAIGNNLKIIVYCCKVLENILHHYNGDRPQNASCQFCEERSPEMRLGLDSCPKSGFSDLCHYKEYKLTAVKSPLVKLE
jgi:hypothetical protein